MNIQRFSSSCLVKAEMSLWGQLNSPGALSPCTHNPQRHNGGRAFRATKNGRRSLSKYERDRRDLSLLLDDLSGFGLILKVPSAMRSHAQHSCLCSSSVRLNDGVTNDAFRSHRWPCEAKAIPNSTTPGPANGVCHLFRRLSHRNWNRDQRNRRDRRAGSDDHLFAGAVSAAEKLFSHRHFEMRKTDAALAIIRILAFRTGSARLGLSMPD